MKPYINIPQNQIRYIHSEILTYVVALVLLVLIFSFKLPHANFTIGDSVAGTTPVTTQRSFLSRRCRYRDEVADLSGRTYSTDDCIIISCSYYLHDSFMEIFTHMYICIYCLQKSFQKKK